jgi:putative nucleotidyltransferase with HDIG domain
VSGEAPHLRPVRSDEDDAPTAASSPHLDLGALFPRHRRREPLLPTDSGARLDVLMRLLVLVGVSLVAAVVVGPRFVGGELPGEDDLGRPARVHVRADLDYALTDEDTTRAHAVEASNRTPAVWDLDLARARADSRVLGAALERLRRALAEMRAGVVVNQRKKPVEEGPPRPPDLPADAFERLETVRAQVAGELSLLGLEAPRDEVWAALTRALWRWPGVAGELESGVRDALSAPVVGDRGLLELHVARGIVVRSVPAEMNRGERVIERVDEVRDLVRARADFSEEMTGRVRDAAPGMSDEDVERAVAFAARALRTTLTYNADESQSRRVRAAEAVATETIRVRRGEVVLRPGEPITRRHLIVLAAMDRAQGDRMRTRAALGTGAFVLLLCFVVYRFGVRGVFRRRLALKDLVFLGGNLLLSLLLVWAADRATAPVLDRWPTVPPLALLCAVPIALGAMLARLCLSADVALLFALLLGLLGGVLAEPGTTWTIVALVSSMVGAAFMARVERRRAMLMAGLSAGVVGGAAALTLEAFRSALSLPQLLWLAAAALLGGALSGMLAALFVPLVEAVFGYVTPIRLRSLTDLNQPLLKDLIVHAPGTWHHSMRVAHLTVAAAHEIRADEGLARAMSLYHDVGKIEQPQFFLENQQGRENPHDKLEPDKSAEILREHVRLGMELCRRHGVPHVVADVIEQHHGDNRMDGFIAKARQKLASERVLSPADEDQLDAGFRYGGPLPTSRESALVMLADQIESASRAIDAPDRDQLREVVDHFTDRALVEDALVRCELSLADLDRVRSAFWLALIELFPSASAAAARDEAEAAQREAGEQEATSEPAEDAQA